MVFLFLAILKDRGAGCTNDPKLTVGHTIYANSVLFLIFEPCKMIGSFVYR